MHTSSWALVSTSAIIQQFFNTRLARFSIHLVSTNVHIQVLDVMAAGGVDGDDETYEWLANAAVRGVDFVTVRKTLELIHSTRRRACVFVCVIIVPSVFRRGSTSYFRG